MFYQVECGPE